MPHRNTEIRALLLELEHQRYVNMLRARSAEAMAGLCASADCLRQDANIGIAYRARIDALCPEETANWKLAPVQPGDGPSIWEPGGFPAQRMFPDEDARIAMGQEFPSAKDYHARGLTDAANNVADAMIALGSYGDLGERANALLEEIWAERNRILRGMPPTPLPSPADASRPSDTKSPAPEDPIP